MPGKRPNEPIAPATIPGQPLDPKIPPDQTDDDEERDDDDAVGTDEHGKEILSPHETPASERVSAAPDVYSDRIASPAAPTSPLRIREIEDLEDDAKGG